MHTADMHTADATCTYIKAHRQMFTLSDVVCAVNSEVVAEGLASVDGIEAAVDSLSLGTAAGWGGVVVTTEALAMAA